MVKIFTYLSACLMNMAGLFLLGLEPGYAMHIKKLPIGTTQAIVVIVDAEKDDLRLFLKDAQGQVYGSFNSIRQQLSKQQLQLGFAMNAGMFHPGYLPVGLYIEQGREQFPLNSSQGFGNFFMQPNGVFYKDATGFHVLTTQAYGQKQATLKPVLATQSGPMLVWEGEINQNFKAESGSVHMRNAVGVMSAQHAAFVITEQPVNFYVLADFFKNTLHIKNALYLDGSISSIYLPEMQRNDAARLLGPMIGVVQPSKQDGL